MSRRRLKRPTTSLEPASLDYESLSKAELSRLHRDYRHMETHRRGLNMPDGTSLPVFNRMMDFLRNEGVDYRTNLTNATSLQFKEQDKKTMANVHSFLNQLDMIHSLTISYGHHIAEEEAQVDHILGQMIKQRIKLQRIYGFALTPVGAAKRFQVLEDRLYHATTLYDEMYCDNIAAQEDIRTMLIQRGMFYRRFTALKRLINEIKAKMHNLVESATTMYDTREDYISRLKLCKDRDQREVRQFEQEIKDLYRQLSRESKAFSFLSTKNKTRHVLEGVREKHERKWRLHERYLDKRLDDYDASMAEIFNLTDTKSVKGVCDKYQAMEGSNFSKYRRLIDLNLECSTLKEANDEIRKAIDVENENESTRAKLQMTEIRQMEVAKFKIENGLNKLSTAMSTQQFKLDSYEADFRNLCTVIGGEALAVANVLGPGLTSIDPKDAVRCMVLMESGIRDLIWKKSMGMDKQKGLSRKGSTVLYRDESVSSKFPSRQSTPKKRGGPFSPNVIVTTHVDGTDAAEDEDKIFVVRPFYSVEMKRYLRQKTQKRSIDASGNLNINVIQLGSEMNAGPSNQQIQKPLTTKGNRDSPKKASLVELSPVHGPEPRPIVAGSTSSEAIESLDNNLEDRTGSEIIEVLPAPASEIIEGLPAAASEIIEVLLAPASEIIEVLSAPASETSVNEEENEDYNEEENNEMNSQGAPDVD